MSEATIQTVMRHVQKAEEHVARQEILLTKLQESGDPRMRASARELLAVFRSTLETHRAHLARLLARL
jgi:hypothetical protein